MRTTLEALGIDRMSIPERRALALEIWASVPSAERISEAVSPRRTTPEEAKEWMRTFVPQDDWERKLLSLGSDWGVVLPPEALTSEGIYD